MSRLAPIFDRIRATGRPGLVTYTTAGDPDLTMSAAVLRAVDRAGADVLEVGVPFSDPLADGPVIQRAAERALASGTTLDRTLAMVEGERPRLTAGVVLFTYANPVFRMGVDTFVRRAAAAGVDGVLVLDLPLEESAPLRSSLAASDIDTIYLLSPTTTTERIREAGRVGRGFLYAISRLGVTGARSAVAEGARALVDRIRAETALPIVVGFGLSRPDHVAEVGAWADAAVVGSALVDVIARRGADPTLPARVERYVRWLKGQATSAEDE